TEVAGLVVRGGRCVGVRDAAGQTHLCDAVALVAGPWTDRLLAPLGIQIGISIERAQIAFFKRPLAVRHCVYIDAISGSYFRPHGNDLTLGGLGALAPETGTDPDNYRQSNDPEFVDEVRARLVARIPQLREAQYVRGHAGIYDVSPDSRPVLGAIDAVPGLFVAAGFSGTGFKTSPAVGAAMSELILEGKGRTVDISAFSFERIRNQRLIRSANEYSMGAGFGHTL
ncbi:MAG TPA: FAD-binding oxidoreductase, partial [Candidatus Binataceae bacterium]|nr:FAD-binding oxidoreductase [Candidatus Binataceae bacterium]